MILFKKINKTPYIIILTHGKWGGEELVKGAEMICGGEIEDIYTFSLLPDQSIEDYMEQVEKNFRSCPHWKYYYC